MSETQFWKRLVIKVGSSLISPNGEGCSSRYLLSIANFIVQCQNAGTQVILVSSGSVAAGKHWIPQKKSGVSVTAKKAMAAAGQANMMASWSALLDFQCAQLLLSQSDFQVHDRYRSIRETIFELLKHNVLPIVNENDAVVTDDSRVGDNDNLAASLAAAIEADAFVICSDIDGLYDKEPSKNSDAMLLKEVNDISDKVYEMAGGAVSSVGTGGMVTKLQAAEKATSQGVATFIVNGKKSETFESLLRGENPGTCFNPQQKLMSQKEHWLRHTTRAKGEVVVEDEVQNRLIENNELNLNYKEIVDVVGEFSAGDTVLIRTDEGRKIAKAKSLCSSCVLNIFVNEDVDDTLLKKVMEPNQIVESQVAAMYRI